jgi:hypothetical protein
MFLPKNFHPILLISVFLTAGCYGYSIILTAGTLHVRGGPTADDVPSPLLRANSTVMSSALTNRKQHERSSF